MICGKVSGISVFDKVQMAHQIAQEGALWPSAMIRLGPNWHKVKWAGIVNCYW